MSDHYARLLDAESELKQIKKRTQSLETTLQKLKPAFQPQEKVVKPESYFPSSPPLPPKSEPIKKASPRPAPMKVKKPQTDSTGFELQMGRVWFVRLGIMLMLTGLVFLGNYAYQNYVTDFGAGMRLALIYLGSITLTTAGIFCERWKESLRSYGKTLAAGGFAAIYYATFATHNVEALKVIESPVLAAFLLGASALLFVGYAQWKQSTQNLEHSPREALT